MKLFPTILMGIFVAFGLGAVIVFATFSSGGGKSAGQVLIWGSLPERVVREAVELVQANNSEFDGVQYQFVRQDDLVPNLIAAIAAGKGPDLVIFPSEHFLSERDKLIVIPYATFSRREFQDTFVEAGEVFVGDKGVYGLPFVIDPLVMYWNRALFAEAGIGTPPKYWDELASASPKLSRADERGTLSQSTAALGTWDNIVHAKAIFVTLLRQLGNPVVALGTRGYASTLTQSTGGVSSADSALRFYTDFSDPVKPAYSWNSSQSDSKTAFIAERLAVYFGRASELAAIRQSNPNLNFDVAEVPQIRGAGKGSEASVFALAIPRGSRNQQGAFQVALALTTSEPQSALQKSLGLPTPRRDGGASAPSDPYFGTFRAAVLTAFAFPDPDPGTSDSVFKRMVENVTSGSKTVSEAIQSGDQELRAIIRN